MSPPGDSLFCDRCGLELGPDDRMDLSEVDRVQLVHREGSCPIPETRFQRATAKRLNDLEREVMQLRALLGRDYRKGLAT